MSEMVDFRLDITATAIAALQDCASSLKATGKLSETNAADLVMVSTMIKDLIDMYEHPEDANAIMCRHL
jgi:enamine deaminase RidA (YjgF/YER057c/UK114 family)